jgi:hypothetical protein
MVHLPHLGKLRREVKEEALDADDPAAAAGAEASPFHKRSRLTQQQQQVGFPFPFPSLPVLQMIGYTVGFKLFTVQSLFSAS